MARQDVNALERRIARENSGITYEELITRLEGERPSRVDAIVHTASHVEMVPLGPRMTGLGHVNDVGLLFDTKGEVPELDDQVAVLTDYAHGQIAARSGIDKKYYDRMRLRQPDLLMKNVETWWRAEPEHRMVRTVRPVSVVDGTVTHGELTNRAWLSDRYRALDNYDFIMTVLETAEQHGAVIHACHLDDERVYLKLIKPSLQGEVKRGDVIQAGCIVRNSEVGDGKVVVQPYTMRIVCLNGLIGTENFAQVHLGGQNEVGILQQDTLAAEAKSTWLQVRDWVKATFEGVFLERRIQEFKRAEGVPVEVKARKAVASVVRTYGLNGADGQEVLDRYLRNGDETMFGLVNAFTQFAHDGCNHFRRQVELEEKGGQLLAMTPARFAHMMAETLSEEQIEKAVNSSYVRN